MTQNSLQRIRTIGLAALSAAAVIVLLAMAPAEVDADLITDASAVRAPVNQVPSGVIDALATAELNEARADSAPQQQVVNGWVARDLLVVLANAADAEYDLTRELTRQNEAIAAIQLATAGERDERPAFLLAIGLAMFALHSLTTTRAGGDESEPPATKATSNDPSEL